MLIKNIGNNEVYNIAGLASVHMPTNLVQIVSHIPFFRLFSV